MDRMSEAFLTSKLAQRTLILFILSALTPMIALYFITSYQVDHLYQNQQQEELRRSAKNFGLIIYERMSLLRRTALSIVSTVETSPDFLAATQFQNNNWPEFSDTKILDPTNIQNTLPWIPNYKKTINTKKQTEIFNDVLVINSSTQDLWMIFSLENFKNEKLLALKLTSNYLWQDLEDFNLSKEFKVYSQENQLLFNSNAKHQLKQGLGTSRPSEKWNLVLTNFNSTPTFRIEATNLEENSLLEQTEFQTLVQLITLLTILLASLISVSVIQKNLKPIQALLNGIKNINSNRFDTPVIINSGDEFEQLGDTFNTMSTKLGRYIHAMRSLSAIDQLILNRFKTEDIINVVVNEGANLLQANIVYLLIADKSPVDFLVHSNKGPIKTIKLDQTTLNALHQPLEFNNSSSLKLNSELNTLLGTDTILYSAVMWNETNAKAVLIAEFDHQPEDDLSGIANSFVEHITIALNNSNWEKRLFEQGHYDVLTGLPNRYLFNSQLINTIEQAKKIGQKIGMFFVNIDNFKAVNDTFGQSIGDKLLIITAKRLSEQIDSGIVYRLGGDEFVIIYNCAESDKDNIIEETGVLAEKIRSAIVKPVQIDAQEIASSISIGITIFPDDSKNPEELLKFSDKAMRQAKKKGLNCYRYYSEIDNKSNLEREEYLIEFHRALTQGEFELYYQPKINISKASIDTCEALIRWNHPQRGIVMPNDFIPLAEAYGVIEDIGRWVIKTAAKQQVEWAMSSINIERIAVNVSVKQLINKNFYNDVVNILRETNCRGEALEFEITETAYTDDLESFKDVVIELKKIGIIFSVDDYGTGYSSLSLLLKLPVDKIKIDKSFIDHIEDDKISLAIVESTIKLAKEMGLRVVAEGVENSGQLSLLINCLCDTVQGYFFSPPVPVKEFEKISIKKIQYELVENNYQV
jgi:diguanylate cyclase (GGDEF)-like protein